MPPTPVVPEEKVQKRLIGILIGLSITSIVVVIVGFVLGMGALTLKPNVRSTAADEKALPGPMVGIPTQIYNLGEPNRYMKSTMELELDMRDQDEQTLAEFRMEVNARKEQIMDLIICEISGKTYRSVSTPEGKEQLKEELRLKINALLSFGELKEVIFTGFAVQ